MNARNGWLIAALLCPLAYAQDAPPPAADTRNLQPRPAEMAPRATRSLLLAITRAGERMVAVGDRGVIVVSSDGENWQQVPCPVQATLTTVSFADANNGWAAGHDAAILHTADGGQTWKLQNFQPELGKPVLSVLALDAQRAYAVGAYGLFLATTDAGASWAPVDAPPILEDGLHLNGLIRLNNGELFVAGETGLLGVSADGSDWQRLKLPYEGSLFGALPRGDKGVLVFGLRGNVYATDDVHGGQWTRIDTQTVQSLFGGTSLAGDEVVLVGADDAVLRVTATGQVRSQARNGTGSSGSLSGVLTLKDQLVVVGEQGVRREPLTP